MRTKLNIKELKKEARSRFERFIAGRLSTEADVGTDSLARDFYGEEEKILRKIAHATQLSILVKWADDILNQSIAKETARNGHPQMVLPMSLQGIEMPGAFSFINGANKLRFVANYKAQKFHLESHAYLLRKHRDDIQTSVEQFETLLDAVLPLMGDERTTLPEALKVLLDNEAGAA